MSSAEWGLLITGMVTAYIVSMLAVKFLMNYVKKHDFKAFGYYRIILGVIVIVSALLKFI
jgi:undecaprenyl-diphosphatase